MLMLSWILKTNNYIFYFPRPPPLWTLLFAAYYHSITKEVPLWTNTFLLFGR